VRDARAFTPIPWQVAPWQDTAPIMLIHSGAGTGKSDLCAHKLNALCLRYPRSLGLWVRKSRTSLKNSSLPLLESIVPQDVHHLQTAFRFQYPNGSRIVYGGMHDEKQREALRSVAGEGSSGADWVVMEEASGFSQADFEELLGRMRGQAAHWRQLMLITNPAHDRHWINQTLVRPHLAGKTHHAELRVSVYHPRPEDNPHLDPAYLQTLRSLSGVMRKRLYDGQWVRAEGVIFEAWDPERHIVEPFPIPDTWRRIRATDFGYQHPRVVLWCAYSPEGVLYVYRQTYQTLQTASESGREIKRLSDRERFETTVCDHDASERAELELLGIRTTPANKEVERGIQIIEDALKANRIRFFRGCLVREDDELRRQFRPTCTEQEFEVYCWKRGADGTVTKDEPEKKNDDGMDALRYAGMYFFRDERPTPPPPGWTKALNGLAPALDGDEWSSTI